MIDTLTAQRFHSPLLMGFENGGGGKSLLYPQKKVERVHAVCADCTNAPCCCCYCLWGPQWGGWGWAGIIQAGYAGWYFFCGDSEPMAVQLFLLCVVHRGSACLSADHIHAHTFERAAGVRCQLAWGAGQGQCEGVLKKCWPKPHSCAPAKSTAVLADSDGMMASASKM